MVPAEQDQDQRERDERGLYSKAAEVQRPVHNTLRREQTIKFEVQPVEMIRR